MPLCAKPDLRPAGAAPAHYILHRGRIGPTLKGAPGVARLRQHPLARALQQPCGMGFALHIRRFIRGGAVHPQRDRDPGLL